MSAALKIDISDSGAVQISDETPRPYQPTSDDFSENLALREDISGLGTLASELIDAIDEDEKTRTKFIANNSTGLDFLGTMMDPATNTKAQKRNTSRVIHPVLMEACIRAQSLARAELLPAAGPCKVTERAGSTEALDELASDLESDMNYYLTRGAPEYYPDMDRGLFGMFFSGNMFKKVYTCPLKRRPVSRVIPFQDLIVSEDATDLETAERVTHRSYMSKVQIQKMQALGLWRQTNLSGSINTLPDIEKRKEMVITGQTPIAVMRDPPREIFECTADIIPADYGIPLEGDFDRDIPEGYPVSYVVTLDKQSREVLALRRGWRQDDTELFQRRQRYVHYGVIPAFGFLCFGYVHLLGNTAKALTAAWRLLCDAGMFANFPGGIKAKGVRTGTNELQPAPGEFVEADVGAFEDIRAAIMPMPYKDPSAVFIQFMQQIAQDANRLAGSIEMEVGEGRANIPVGTIMTMIEQQTQTMGAVHKRLCQAQQQELILIKEEFRENPELLAKLNPKPRRLWESWEEMANSSLLPASDPNVPSQMHRIMRNMLLVQTADANTDIYDKYAVHRRAWRSMGLDDIDAVLHPPKQEGGIPPQVAGVIAQKQGEMKVKGAELQQRAAEDQSQQETERMRIQSESETAAAERQADQQSDMMKFALDKAKIDVEAAKAGVPAPTGIAPPAHAGFASMPEPAGLPA